MFIKYEKRKNAKGMIRTSVRIVESTRIGGKIVQKPIKSFGILELQPNQTLFLNEVKKELNILNNDRDKEIRLIIKDEDNFNRSERNVSYNYGFKYIESIYDYLKIDEFLNDYQDSLGSREKYKLSEIVKFLTIERILSPDSKRCQTSHIDRYYNKSYNFSLDDVYRSMDLLCPAFDDLQLHLRKITKKLFKEDNSDKIYYDVTNYYTEIDFNDIDGLRKRGVSKEHRVDPIVGMGLFMNGNGIPLGISVFPGNTSEQTTLIGGIEKIRKDEKLDRVVVVADKGLNSLPNISKLLKMGNGYVFSQVVRGLKGVKYQNLINNDEIEWISAYNSDKEVYYKYKLTTETFNYKYYDVDGKYVSIDICQQVLVYWDMKDFLMARRKRNEKIKNANKALKNGAYNIPHGTSEYQKEDIVLEDSNEVITEKVKKVKSINEDKIEEDEKWDGYFCLITSELDYDHDKIREVYSQLWKIEDTFRVSKTNLLFRPIYHFKTEHIYSHFLICYLGLFICRLFQYKLEKTGVSLSIERIARVLNKMELNETSDDIVHICSIAGAKEYKNKTDEDGEKVYSNSFSEEDEIWKDYQLINCTFDLHYDKSYDEKRKFNKYFKSISFI